MKPIQSILKAFAWSFAITLVITGLLLVISQVAAIVIG